MWRMHDAGDQACYRLLNCGRHTPPCYACISVSREQGTKYRALLVWHSLKSFTEDFVTILQSNMYLSTLTYTLARAVPRTLLLSMTCT